MRKFLLFVFLSFFVSSGFAIDCQDGMDEKLVVLDATKLGTDMYDTNVSADKIEWVDYKLPNNSYTGGRWSLKNEKDANLNVSGVAICVDNDESVDLKNLIKGNYCWCNVEIVDNYRVSSYWQKVKEFNRYNVDQSRQNTEQQKNFVKEQNVQDCMDNCASSCQAKQSSLVRSINGFYNCGRAIQKLQSVRCVIDNKFVNVKTILFFDDTAEIQLLGGGSVAFTRENEQNFDYIGDYNNDTIYLRLKNKQVYIGRSKYSMEECL